MKIHIWRLLQLLPLCLCTYLLLVSVSHAAQAEDYLIEATADPPFVTYQPDTANRVNIRVTVRDATGANAPNLTPVRFSTTLGAIPAQANTQNGQVLVSLENTQGPGPATIYIQVGATRQVLEVRYLGAGESAGPRADSERLHYGLKATQCYYSNGKEVFDLIGAARFTAPTFTVEAPRLQFDVRQHLLKAQGDIQQNTVIITAGDQKFAAQALTIDLDHHFAALRMVDVQDVRYTYQLFDLKKLVPTDDTGNQAKNANYDRLETTPTRTWIISSEATIFPGEQIQFRHPGFYFDGFEICFLRLPYHVLSLSHSTSNTLFNSEISLTSDAGVNVDFPVYYAANASHIGSLHLRNVPTGSSLGGTPGFQVGIQEEYRIGSAIDGALFLDDLSRPTRSASWDHSQKFGKTSVNLNASYDRYSADVPYTTSTRMSLARPVGDVSLYLTSNWSAYDANQQGLAELSATLPSIPLGKTRLGLNFGPYVGWSGAKTVNAATDTSPLSITKSDSLYQGLRSTLEMPTLRFLGGAIMPSLSNEVTHNNVGEIKNCFDSSIRYQRRIFNIFSSSIGYSYGLTSSNKDTTSAVPSQRVNFDLSGFGNNWNIMCYSSYTLETQSMYSSASVEYDLPWNRARNGTRRWFIDYSASFNSSKNTPLSADHLFTLGRPIGSYTLLMHYSPTGNTSVTGIGTGTGKKWAFEVVRQGW